MTFPKTLKILWELFYPQSVCRKEKVISHKSQFVEILKKNKKKKKQKKTNKTSVAEPRRKGSFF